MIINHLNGQYAIDMSNIIAIDAKYNAYKYITDNATDLKLMDVEINKSFLPHKNFKVTEEEAKRIINEFNEYLKVNNK